MSHDAEIRQARVYLTEARRRRRSVQQQRNFCFVLLAWAANARRRAVVTVPVQGELFGGAA